MVPEVTRIDPCHPVMIHETLDFVVAQDTVLPVPLPRGSIVPSLELVLVATDLCHTLQTIRGQKGHTLPEPDTRSSPLGRVVLVAPDPQTFAHEDDTDRNPNQSAHPAVQPGGASTSGRPPNLSAMTVFGSNWMPASVCCVCCCIWNSRTTGTTSPL